ncbi:MAG: acetyl-CoA carboxylase biotin carboxyl carrier protein [Acidobacteria bacterium]|nr:acetyl-CoA carboxylase biotin carboxyl carrier protein [Acidobacteriota bacterium]
MQPIKELVDLVTEKGISEFELERAGVRLKISRNTGAARALAEQTVVAQPAGARSPALPPPGSEQAGLSPAETETGAPGRPEALHVVRSPMVGTFYTSPGQDAAPFVGVGDEVKPGQVICIIEAMKLMNEIEAEITGSVVKCYVENGQPVEYGEPLFDLRPVVSSQEGD